VEFIIDCQSTSLPDSELDASKILILVLLAVAKICKINEC